MEIQTYTQASYYICVYHLCKVCICVKLFVLYLCQKESNSTKRMILNRPLKTDDDMTYNNLQ